MDQQTRDDGYFIQQLFNLKHVCSAIAKETYTHTLKHYNPKRRACRHKLPKKQ